MISYTSQVKNEIFAKIPPTNLEIFSELYAILSAKNSIDIKNKKIEIKIDNIGIAKRIYSLLKINTQLKMLIKYSTSNSFGKHNVYTITIFRQKYIDEFLKKLQFSFLDILNNDEIFRGYLRGIFLICGYIKEPKKEYSLDFFIDNEDTAINLYNILLKKKKKVSTTKKRKKFLVYLRNSEDIMDILVNIGALQHFFSYEETTMIKDLKNKTIREMNYEVANETKSLNTGLKQLKIINFIGQKIGLNALPEVLEEAAFLRLQNPESSLQELADMANISKSGIRNRFRRIEEIYNELKENNN